MTGFKDGATESPFDDEAAESDEDSGEEQTADHPPVETTDRETVTDDSKSTGGAEELPWKYRRESTQDGRKQRQIHLQPETISREGKFQSAVADAVGEEVVKADLREAAMLVAMDHIDEVADQLREWGYDYG